MSEGSSADFLEKNCLDEYLPDRSSRLAPKTEDSQVRQHRVIASRARYRKSQRKGEDHWRNKIYLVVGESSNTEASVYYYVIDQY